MLSLKLGSSYQKVFKILNYFFPFFFFFPPVLSAHVLRVSILTIVENK